LTAKEYALVLFDRSKKKVYLHCEPAMIYRFRRMPEPAGVAISSVGENALWNSPSYKRQLPPFAKPFGRAGTSRRPTLSGQAQFGVFGLLASKVNPLKSNQTNQLNQPNQSPES
jgi:hypothetical protein